MKIQKLTTIISTLVVPLWLVSCANSVTSSGDPLVPSTADSGGDSDGSSIDLVTGTTALGVMDFKQTFESMLYVTGLTRTSAPTATTYYNNNKASFINSNDAQSFSAGNQLAVANLAYEMCVGVVDSVAERARFFAGTPFELLNSDALHRPSVLLNTAEKKRNAVKLITSKFWGNEIFPTSIRNQHEEDLVKLLESLIASETDNSATTRTSMVGICTAALSSSEMVLF